MGWMEDLGLSPAGVALLAPEARREVAAFLVRWGCYSDSLPVLRQLVEEDPCARVSAWLVEALVGTGAGREALRSADALIERHPSDPEAAAARADALLAAGRKEEALAYARALMDAGEGGRPLALERMARIRLAAGDLRGALAAAERCVALAPPGMGRAAPLRTLSQVLTGNPWKSSRQAEVRAEMASAYETDLERLRKLTGSTAAPAPTPALPARGEGASRARSSAAQAPTPALPARGEGASRARTSAAQAPTPARPARGEGARAADPAPQEHSKRASGPSGRAAEASRPAKQNVGFCGQAAGPTEGEAPAETAQQELRPPAGQARAETAQQELRPPADGALPRARGRGEAGVWGARQGDAGGPAPDRRPGEGLAAAMSPKPAAQDAGQPSHTDLRGALQRLFGHEEFRPGQREVVEAVLAGQDVLAVLPTGAGKSLCYQLPAALLPGATVVISPLIALMKDQLEGLPPALAERATVVHSALEMGEVDQRLRGLAAGDYRLIYAAPERLRQWPFLDALRRARISLFVIDEAHCLSLWGHDFRPDYLFIGPALHRLGNPPVLAMTATATPPVQEEVGRRLGRDLRRISLGVFRPNLRLEVVAAAADEEKLRLLADLCRAEEGPIIVYANARERCEDLARMLRGRRVQALHYHAGLEREERAAVQDSFMSGQVRVVVATVAFGMGVDKADVRMVVHYNLPRSLESYYQEAGRAGRDGHPSRCVLLATPGDRGNLTRWMSQERLPITLLGDTYHAVRRAAGAGRVARIAMADVVRATECADETQLRVALSLLEQVGLLRRHMDVPRVLTLYLRRPPEGPDLQALVAAAGLRQGQSVTVDPLELSAACGVPAGDLEGLILRGQESGWLSCRGSGRDPLLEVPPAPPDARAALDRLLAAHEEQQNQRLEHMVGYVKTRSCRHRFIAEHFGERAPRCPGCDNCEPGRPGTRVTSSARPRATPARKKSPPPDPAAGRPPQRGAPPESGADASSPVALVALRCVASLPFAVGVKGLTNTLLGSLMAPVGPDRCPSHGALAGHPKARIERLARVLVAGGYLARDDSIPQRPTLRLTDKGRQALAEGSLR